VVAATGRIGVAATARIVVAATARSKKGGPEDSAPLI